MRRKIILLSAVLFVILFNHAGGASAGAAVPAETDATGEKFFFNSAPARIISLNPSATEIIRDLGLGARLIGVTTFCPRKGLKEDVRVIGTVLDPDVETIIALRPDIVFATVDGNRKRPVLLLRQAGIKVFVLEKVRTFDELFSQIALVGRITFAADEASVLIKRGQTELDRVSETVKGPGPPVKVFIQINTDPIMTAGGGSIITEMVDIAGGENIASDVDMGYPIYSKESVVSEDPDVIVIVYMGPGTKDAAKVWDAFTGIKAVKNDRIYMLDSGIMCNMGPGLIDGVVALARCFYPERFAAGVTDES